MGYIFAREVLGSSGFPSWQVSFRMQRSVISTSAMVMPTAAAVIIQNLRSSVRLGVVLAVSDVVLGRNSCAARSEVRGNEHYSGQTGQ